MFHFSNPISVMNTISLSSQSVKSINSMILDICHEAGDYAEHSFTFIVDTDGNILEETDEVLHNEDNVEFEISFNASGNGYICVTNVVGCNGNNEDYDISDWDELRVYSSEFVDEWVLGY